MRALAIALVLVHLLCAAVHGWVPVRSPVAPKHRIYLRTLARPAKQATTAAASAKSAKHALPDALMRAAEELRAKASQEEKALHLMTLGQRFRKQLLPQNRALLERVAGCTSIVWVHANQTESGVEVYGEADSQVAQGLLTLLHIGLAKCSTADVRKLSADAITEACGLEDVISSARITGFGNILKLIQEQLETPQPQKQPKPELLQDVPSLARPSKPLIPKEAKEEVAMLVSGGVDSSVALGLLKRAGIPVRAYYLKIWLEDEAKFLGLQCPWEEDIDYASRVCAKLDVPFETLSLQNEYHDHVVRYTLEEAKRGHTPNPDIMCNSRIKFGVFDEYMGKHFKAIATGHYAQVVNKYNERTGEEYVELIRSLDSIKDQTYFLSMLKPSQLQRCIFPVGKYSKRRVREFAREMELPTMDRKDSQGICFLGKLNFDDFIYHYLGENPGLIKKYPTGEVLGEHKGLWFHTVGQRRGIGRLLVPSIAAKGSWYTVARSPADNVLWITNDYDNVIANRKRFTVRDINWLNFKPSDNPYWKRDVAIQVRHGPGWHRGNITHTPDGDPNSVRVMLEDRDQGLAAGQYAAFYIRDRCIGAGSIQHV